MLGGNANIPKIEELPLDIFTETLYWDPCLYDGKWHHYSDKFDKFVYTDINRDTTIDWYGVDTNDPGGLIYPDQ